ncbi:MAG: XRE family transcriptional regulator [Desulfovibrionaceae bacterium]
MARGSVQGALAFDDAMLPRAARVRLWLARAGFPSLRALADAMGVHRSLPGKMLVARTEPIPPQRREWLLGRGCPADLVDEGPGDGVGLDAISSKDAL